MPTSAKRLLAKASIHGWESVATVEADFTEITFTRGDDVALAVFIAGGFALGLTWTRCHCDAHPAPHAVSVPTMIGYRDLCPRVSETRSS